MITRRIGGLSVLVLITWVGSAQAATKIAPGDAAPGEPFTIVDAPEGRLVDGSLAVFRLGGLEMVLPLRTRRPFNTAHGRLPLDMYGGVYGVSARLPNGSELDLGVFTVIGTPAPPPFIAPDSGAPGDAFTIVDALARIAPGDVAIVYPEGTDPASGAFATGVAVSSDGTTLTGNVPGGLARGVPHFVAVRAAADADSRFADLPFFVTPVPGLDTLYVLVAQDQVAGPHRILRGSIGAGGALSFTAPIMTTGGTSRSLTSDSGLAVSPDHAFLFVGHNESNQIETFAIAPDGGLVSTDTQSVNRPGDIELHPTLPLVYATDLVRETGETSNIKVFAYSPAGALSLVQSLATAVDLRGTAITTDGSYLVTSHIGFAATAKVQVYAIDAVGAVSGPVASVEPTGAGRLDDVVIDPVTRTVYVKDLDRGVFAFALSAAGELSPLNGGAPYRLRGAFALDVEVAGGALVALSADHPGPPPTFLQLLMIQPGGELAAVSEFTFEDDQPRHLVATDGGTTLFATGWLHSLVYSINVDSSLSASQNAGSPFVVTLLPSEVLGNLIAVR